MTTLDTWSIVESTFDVAHNRHYEGLMAIGSGTLQQRAAFEEGLRDDPQDIEYLRVMGNVTVEQFPSFKSRVGTYLPRVSGPHPTCRDQLIHLPALHGLLIYTTASASHGCERITDYTARRTCARATWSANSPGRPSPRPPAPALRALHQSPPPARQGLRARSATRTAPPPNALPGTLDARSAPMATTISGR